MRPAAFLLALVLTTLASAAPDIIGGPGDREWGGGSLPLAPVVATSVLASVLAWVLAILRRRKTKAEGPARDANP